MQENYSLPPSGFVTVHKTFSALKSNTHALPSSAAVEIIISSVGFHLTHRIKPSLV